MDRASASGAEEHGSSPCGGTARKPPFRAVFLLRPVSAAARNQFLGYNWSVSQNFLPFIFFGILFLSGCGVAIEDSFQTTATPGFVTATLPPTAPAKATPTSLPPTPIPTSAPVEGTTTTQINVRSEPSTAGDSLDTVAPFSKVQIIGKDPFGAWYLIVQANAPAEKGWINAKYVQIEQSAEIMVVEVESVSGSGVSGLVIQPINVRSGPGTNYETLGKLNPDDVVPVTGRDVTGAWFEVEFKDNTGWVSAEFMQVEEVDALPVQTEKAGEEEAEESITQSPGSGFIPAILDGDSMQSPSAVVVISSMGVRTFQFDGSVSSPQGDNEDWIQFELINSSALIEVKCTGDAVEIILHMDGRTISEHRVFCDKGIQFTAREDGILTLQVREMPNEQFQFTNYTLKLKAVQQ